VEQSRSAVVTRAVRGAEPAISAIGQLLTRPLQGMVFPADIESMAGMSSGELVELTGGVDQLTFGILPEELSRELQSLPVVGKIIGIGFAWKGKVNGNAIFVRHPEILTVFVRNAAAVLQRRQAEAARKESDTIARALIDASPDASILIDTQGTILCANGIAAERTGKSIETLIGSNAFDRIPREPSSSYREWVKEALESGRPVHGKDIRGSFTVDHYIYPIKNREGEITRLAISTREVPKT
jgi:PAS domain S-box-containing protein